MRGRVALRRAAFVDRDDTIAQDVPYCSRPEDLHLLPTVGEGIALLNRAGLLVVVVTNQSGISRGFFTHDDLAGIHEKMRADLAAHGASIDGLYYCPHRPEDGCDCRKPLPKLLFEGARDLGIDVANSAVIGDRAMDVEMARRAGCLAVMVPRGKGVAELPTIAPPPDFVAPNFLVAARWVAARLARPGDARPA